MPTTFPTRRATAALTAFLALVAILVAGLSHAADAGAVTPAKAKKVAAGGQVKGAKSKRGKVVTYRLKSIRGKRIKSARLKAKTRKGRKLSVKKVRRAAKKGVLRVTVPPVLLMPAAPAVPFNEPAPAPQQPATPPVLVVDVGNKVVEIPPVVVQPKPAPAPAAPKSSCTGNFGVGNWPGACWRPYSDDSPFNRKLPANPKVHPNSSNIVKRSLGFGPIQHLTANTAGTDRDSGDTMYWSQPTDPEYTVDCVENWGRCAVEGVKVRIPAQAKQAGATDGHMTVIDQASGWEYDFWQVRDKPAAGGTLVISWGGKTRIDGDGLGSDGTAARFGNMAGKIRAEELEAGRINHALFIAMGCDDGKFVYPALKAGLSCAESGQSTANAPTMGMQFMLDMTPTEIDALPVPAWKKTILRALAEYGAFFGDTGGSMAFAEESGQSRTSFGAEDPWVTIAKQNNLPYYAPDDVWIFNMRETVDWQGRLRVVDPCVAARSC